MSRRYRLTEAADADVTDILSESARLFGPRQRDVYAHLIEKAINLVADAPGWPGTRLREDLGEGVRSFHLELAAGRQGAASHAVYYIAGRMEDGSEGIIVLRVLHERMDPAVHVEQELREADG